MFICGAEYVGVGGGGAPRPIRRMQTFRSPEGLDNGAEAAVVCGRNE